MMNINEQAKKDKEPASFEDIKKAAKEHENLIESDKNKMIRDIFKNGGKTEIIQTSSSKIKKISFWERLSYVFGIK